MGCGVFGVPTLEKDGHLFWGVDMLDMANEYASNPKIFNSGDYNYLENIEDGLHPK